MMGSNLIFTPSMRTAVPPASRPERAEGMTTLAASVVKDRRGSMAMSGSRARARAVPKGRAESGSEPMTSAASHALGCRHHAVLRPVRCRAALRRRRD